MKPTIKLAAARTPDGGEMVLYTHDDNFSIRVNGLELMNSRQHESELELARLGCAHLTNHPEPRILIGGLGMGYTLRQALELLGPRSHVVVGELLKLVVKWNRTYFAELNDRPLDDKRVELKTGNVLNLITRSENTFDAILLDIDNGPSAMTDSGNQSLYSRRGVEACYLALRRQGCLAVWSAEPNKAFEKLLMSCSFHARRFSAAPYKGSKSKNRFIFVATKDKSILPPGGGELRVK